MKGLQGVSTSCSWRTSR